MLNAPRSAGMNSRPRSRFRAISTRTSIFFNLFSTTRMRTRGILPYFRSAAELSREVDEVLRIDVEARLERDVLLRRIPELQRPLNEGGAQPRARRGIEVVLVRGDHQYLAGRQTEQPGGAAVGL